MIHPSESDSVQRYVNAQFQLQRYEYGIRNAVKSGHWGALQWWAYSYLGDPVLLDYFIVFELAALHGHEPILQRLRDKGICADVRYHGISVRSAHPCVARWMDGDQAMLIDVSPAVAAGDLEFIRWVRQRLRGLFNVTGENWNEDGRLAARIGHRELVQWLQSQFGKVEGDLLTGAVEGGRSDIVQ